MAFHSDTYSLPPPYIQEPPPAYTKIDPSLQSSSSPNRRNSRHFRANRHVAQPFQFSLATHISTHTPHIAPLVVQYTANGDSERPVPSPVKSTYPQERAQDSDAPIDIPQVDAVEQPLQDLEANSEASSLPRLRTRPRMSIAACCMVCSTIAFLAVIICLLATANDNEENTE
jgi:hypothetical protein